MKGWIGKYFDQIITSFRATPPRFFSELNGKTWRTVELDLIRSKFIPNCHIKMSSVSNQHTLLTKGEIDREKKNTGTKVRVPWLPMKELPSLSVILKPLALHHPMKQNKIGDLTLDNKTLVIFIKSKTHWWQLKRERKG